VPVPFVVVRQQTLRLGDAWARIGPWRGGGDAAQVVIAGEPDDVSPDLVERCCDHARRRGFGRVVTNAVTPDESEGFLAAGFSVRERLHLLRLDLVAEPDPPAHALTRAGRRDRDDVLTLDRRAFEPFWQLGPVGLRDAITATPVARFRVGRDAGRVAAYGVTGRAGSQGYLQRVAVDPDARGRGWGRAVVADALRWLWDEGATTAHVNTQVGNDAALTLYESYGFVRRPGGLCVLGRTL
jgi:ribosomal protein S18 acetylase RimI-like enzyme